MEEITLFIYDVSSGSFKHEEVISDDLCALTEYLTNKVFGGVHQGRGFLGGEFGYGVNYENDVFMMHMYCWCDKDSCQWCMGDAPNFLHKKSGLSIKWYKYIGRDTEINQKITKKKWKEILKDCKQSVNL